MPDEPLTSPEETAPLIIPAPAAETKIIRLIPKLPPGLAVLESAAGANRRGLKVLVYGPPKAGKSYMLASFPGPLFALACGESGIEPYLDKSRGDKCLSIHNGDDLMAAVNYGMGLGPSSPWKSFLLDNVNLAWEDYADGKAEELGVDEIRGGNWKKVKGPWRAMVRKLMRSGIHVGMSAWIKDLLYTQESALPGMEAKLSMKEQDNPQVEKTILYAPDLIFKCDFIRDAKYKPTQFHNVIFYGGRRPRTVKPEDFYTGKTWKFDSRKPVNVWDEVIGPVYAAWTDGAVDFLGVDPEEAMTELRAMKEAGEDETLGRLLTLIAGQKSMAEFKKAYETVILMEIASLSVERQAIVNEAKNKKKTELQGAAK